MPRVLPGEFKDGDALEPWHLNFIFAFIRRWMKFEAAPPLSFDNPSDSPPHLSLLAGDELVPVLTPSGGITIGSYSAPTHGTGNLLIESSAAAGFPTTGPAVTLYNPYTKTVTASVFGWAKWRGAFLYIVTWDC